MSNAINQLEQPVQIRIKSLITKRFGFKQGEVYGWSDSDLVTFYLKIKVSELSDQDVEDYKTWTKAV